MLRRPSSSLYVHSQSSNVFFYEITWPFIIKLHIEHPQEGGGTKVCINGQGHMTKMAAISLYCKNLYKASSPEQGVYGMKLGMQHWGLKFCKAGINDDLRLTLTYFTAWSKLDTCEFEWEVCYKVIKWEKLQMGKTANDQINRFIFQKKKTFTTGGCLSLSRGYICVYYLFFSNNFSRNRLTNQGQTF